MKLPRRRQFLHLAAGAAALPAVSRFAWAQAYPSRPVRIVVGFAAGGATRHPRAPDGSMAVGAARPAIRHREPAGRRHQYRHRGGRARAPDGYTLLAVSPANAINATLYEKLNFNFIRDIAPVASIIREPHVMVVNPSVPAKTVPEFIAYAKANPGKLSMASAGNGTASHMAGELFKMMAGVDMVHVPYRGGGPALTDLLGGQVQVMFPGTTASVEYIKSGKLRALGGDHCDALGGVAGHCRPWAISCRATRRAAGWRRRAQKHARRNHRQAQQGNQRRPRRSQDQGAVRRPWRRRCFRARPPISGS